MARKETRAVRSMDVFMGTVVKERTGNIKKQQGKNEKENSGL